MNNSDLQNQLVIFFTENTDGTVEEVTDMVEKAYQIAKFERMPTYEATSIRLKGELKKEFSEDREAIKRKVYRDKSTFEDEVSMEY